MTRTTCLLLSCLATLALGGCGSSEDGQSSTASSGGKTAAAGSSNVTAQQDAVPGAASGLTAEVTCSPLERRQGFALLSWTPADPLGDAQLVQITIFKDGFDTGEFIELGPLGADEGSLQFEDVQGQALHRWRVLTTRGNESLASETARFEGPICLGDVVEQGPPPPG